MSVLAARWTPAQGRVTKFRSLSLYSTPSVLVALRVGARMAMS